MSIPRRAAASRDFALEGPIIRPVPGAARAHQPPIPLPPSPQTAAPTRCGHTQVDAGSSPQVGGGFAGVEADDAAPASTDVALPHEIHPSVRRQGQQKAAGRSIGWRPGGRSAGGPQQRSVVIGPWRLDQQIAMPVPAADVFEDDQSESLHGRRAQRMRGWGLFANARGCNPRAFGETIASRRLRRGRS